MFSYVVPLQCNGVLGVLVHAVLGVVWDNSGLVVFTNTIARVVMEVLFLSTSTLMYFRLLSVACQSRHS